MNRLSNSDEWNQVLSAPRAVVYKHSDACPVSYGALRQVDEFARSHPDLPVYIVDVLSHRDLSMQIANELGVIHQSPQAIIVQEGSPAWHASHWAVRAAELEHAVCRLDHAGDPEAAERECADDAAPAPYLTLPRGTVYAGLAAMTAVLLYALGGVDAVVTGVGAAALVPIARSFRRAR